MAALLSSDDDDETTGADGSTTSVNAAPNTDTAGGSGGGSGAASGATAGSTSGAATGANTTTPANASSQATSPNTNDSNAIVNANEGFDFSPLLDTVRNQGTTARNAINTANTTFNTGLGATPTFGAAQQATLANVINGSDPTLADGSSIVGYNPAAPTAINNASYDPLVSQYETSAGDTQNQQGITALLQNLRPDLTPGDLSYDSLAYSGNPNFQAQASGIQADANAVGNLAGTTTTNANNAVTQRNSDVSAFDAAAKAYVNGQLTDDNTAMNNQLAAANAYDQGVSGYLNGGIQSQAGLSAVPSGYLNFDPTGYAPQDFTAQQPGNTFNENVDPNSFLTFNQGQLPTLANTATAPQILRFNNANDLLGSANQLTGTARSAASIGINQQAWQAAQNKALSDRNASDIAWLAAHQPVPSSPTAAAVPPNYVGSNGQDGNGADASDNGADDEADAANASDAADAAEAESDADADADAGDADAGDADAGDAGDAGDGEGGEGGEGDGGGEGGDGGGEHKGGWVKRVPVANVPVANVPVKPVARRNYVSGGAVPMNAGPPGQDTVPTNVNNGEFVIRAPSTLALGASNLNGLNHLNAADPVQQQAVKNALHVALTRAAGNRRIM